MSKAQIDTFLKGLETNTLFNYKIEVYNIIKNNPNCTIDTVFLYSQAPKKSTVVARVTELADLGVIKYHGTIETYHGTLSKIEIVTDTKEQLQLQKTRANNKRKRAIKSLVNQFKNTLQPKTYQQLLLELKK